MSEQERDPLFEQISRAVPVYDVDEARARQLVAPAREAFAKASAEPSPGLVRARYRFVEMAAVLMVSVLQLGHAASIAWQYFG